MQSSIFFCLVEYEIRIILQKAIKINFVKCIRNEWEIQIQFGMGKRGF
jgi:hypothetical protein